MLQLRTLQPAAAYGLPQFRNLRRLTDPPAVGLTNYSYALTPRAAHLLNEYPFPLLQYRLNPVGQEPQMIVADGRPVCVVAGGPDELTLASNSKPFQTNVAVCLPEELPDRAEVRAVPLDGPYPAPYLPFDLSLAHQRFRSDRFSGGQAKPNREIDLASCPFLTYRAFRQLTQPADPLQPRMAGLRRHLDLGSGLGMISFTLAALLPWAEITSLEISKELLVDQQQINAWLERSLGYKFPNIRPKLGNAFDRQRIELGDYDSAGGWFPMAHSISDQQWIGLLRGLKPGSLFFQLFSNQPLDRNELDPGCGFQPVKPEPTMAYQVFERL